MTEKLLTGTLSLNGCVCSLGFGIFLLSSLFSSKILIKSAVSLSCIKTTIPKQTLFPSLCIHLIQRSKIIMSKETSGTLVGTSSSRVELNSEILLGLVLVVNKQTKVLQRCGHDHHSKLQIASSLLLFFN